MKRTGLGSDPLSWITPTVPEAEKKGNELPEETDKKNIIKKMESGTPKFKTFDVRLTVLFREDQLTFLDKIVREVNKNRDHEYRKERITKNTVLRTFVDAFQSARFNLKNVQDETTLLTRIREMVKR
ncbi:MAG: hypothetical protein M1501_01820 [Candidatus Omnitrophica bacterium]|nr:hypothetical protein [Candidatus Omnitrophota bacterium]